MNYYQTQEAGSKVSFLLSLKNTPEDIETTSIEAFTHRLSTPDCSEQLISMLTSRGFTTNRSEATRKL